MENLIGMKFGRLTVISYSHRDKWRSHYFICECDCGNQSIVRSTNLKNGKTKSCGCLQKEIVSEYGKLTKGKNKKTDVDAYSKNMGGFIIKDKYELSISRFIYKLTNLINGKIYIGKTERSLKEHLKRYNRIINNVKNQKRYVDKALKKYGMGNFRFEIIDFCNDSNLNDLEIFYIAKFHSNDSLIGYNLTIGGEGASGFKWNEESKNNLSASMKGKYDGENNPFYGKTHSSSTKDKIAESNRRRIGKRAKKPISLETKEKISQSNLGKHSGEKNGKSRKYVVFSPDNTRYDFMGGLIGFCRENNIKSIHFVRKVLNEEIENYEGWRFYYYEKFSINSNN